jgi:hypothetical protein
MIKDERVLLYLVVEPEVNSECSFGCFNPVPPVFWNV